MSYFDISNKDKPVMAIPPGFDAAIVSKDVASLTNWEGRPVVFADEESVRIALLHADVAAAERIKRWMSKSQEVAFYRHIPKKLFGALAEYSGGSGYLDSVMREIRGIKHKLQYDTFHVRTEHFTDSEVDQVAAVFSADGEKNSE
jgi:hypothetical protein